MWERRLAIQLAAQLPDNAEQCAVVIEYLKKVVDAVYADDPPLVLDDIELSLGGMSKTPNN